MLADQKEASKAVCLSQIEFRFSKAKDSFNLSIRSLDIAVGEKVALVGASGSGKSTLLGLICGVLLPQSGTVEVFGNRLNDFSGAQRDSFRADNLGIIFQQFNLLPYLSVLDNVVLGLSFSRFRSLGAPEQRARAERLLTSLDIDIGKMGKQKVANLSVGQQQRVAAARAFVTEPRLIVADEPTSALDEGRQDEFLDLLFAQQERTGATLLLVTHDPRLASRFDRVIDLEATLALDAGSV